MNFYQENRNFLEPAIHWMGEKDGKTISECPLIYFTVAKLWKIFGHQEFIFRLINLLLVYLGLFCLFRLLQGMLNDTFWSISITVLLFTSPILVYYSNNFTADAPAFGLSLTGCYFMWRGIQFKKNSWFFISFVFFLLGGLIKISSLLAFMAFFIIHVYQVLFSKKEEKSLFQWFYLLPYVFVLLVQYIWFNYVQKYNQENVGGIFLTEIFPIWDIDEVTRVNIWKLFIIENFH
jgi:4-amino-4-deoxy-L-arabinose transferase-like glycosyltransferase